MTDAKRRVLQALERIRPALQMDGGDIRLVEWHESEGLVRVELEEAGSPHGVSSSCNTSSCTASSTTMMQGVERVLKQLVPEVRVVEAA
ncbi:MAG: NifU family protein [Candidatus Thermoplasmatota archaeon]